MEIESCNRERDVTAALSRIVRMLSGIRMVQNISIYTNPKRQIYKLKCICVLKTFSNDVNPWLAILTFVAIILNRFSLLLVIPHDAHV